MNEMQNKTTIKFYFAPSSNVGKDVEKMETLYTVGGNIN
jgi:hypothetical protein